MNLKKSKTMCLIFCAVFLALAFAFSPVEVKAETTEFRVSDQTDLINAVTQINQTEGGNFTIMLEDDIVLEGKEKRVLFSSDSTTTIYGGGYTLTIGKEAGFLVTDNAVVNLGAEGYNEALNITAPDEQVTAISIGESGVLNMYDKVTISDSLSFNSSGGGIQMLGNSTFNMYGGTITECRSSNSGAGGVYAEGTATFNMYGGTISNCYGRKGAGGVVVTESAEFNMHGGTITECKLLEDDASGAGGVLVEGEATFTMQNGTIIGCENQRNGAGGVVVTENAEFEMHGGEIDNCTSDNGAGGVLVEGYATFTMQNGNIIECKYLGHSNGAGGVLVTENAKFDMNGGTIAECEILEKNAIGPLVEGDATFTMQNGIITESKLLKGKASGAGGVLVEGTANFTMQNGTITECKYSGSSKCAGGVYVKGDATFTMQNGAITECGFLEDGAVGGGGVYVSEGAKFDMHGGEISNCYSHVAAAGVYVDMEAEFIMYNGTITECKVNAPIENPTEGVGGVALADQANFIMHNGAITKCEIPESSYGTGGVHVTEGTTFEMYGGEITGCKTGYLGGGGVALYYGTVIIFDGAKIYDNEAVGCGDDIFFFGGENASLTLCEVPRGLTLSDCGSEHEIDGWYIDGLKDNEETPRWYADPCGQSAQGQNYVKKYLPVGVIKTGIALKAAHGTEPSPPEPEQPTEPEKPTVPEKPTPLEKPTEPEQPARTPVRDTVTVEIGGEKPQTNPAEENPNTGAPVLTGVAKGAIAAVAAVLSFIK